MREKIQPFLSCLTRPKIVRISIFSGSVIIVATLIHAAYFFDVLNLFTGEAFETAELLRMSYEATLTLTGYLILLLGFLWSAFSMLQNDNFKANSKKLQIQFIILSAFITSFFIARAFVVLLDIPINYTFQLWLKGYRIHHFFFGIGLLGIGGWLGHIRYGHRVTQISAALYGGGLGLVVDEFGLLLTFGDYWSPLSHIFFVTVSLFLLIMLLFEAYKVFSTSSSSLSKGSTSPSRQMSFK